MKQFGGWFIPAVLMLALMAAVPCAAGTYFETSWNTALGNSELALTDGYRFTGVTGANLLKAETGGIAGNNLLGVWLNDQQYGHSYVMRLPIMDYPDFYYRFYVRVYPKNGISYPNFHGIQNFDQNDPTNFYFSVRDHGASSTWNVAIGTYAAQPENMDKHYSAGGFAFNQWYRVEGHIRWYSHADWAAPTKWELKMYDASNNLVLDESKLIGMSTGVSLKAYYDQGKKYYLQGKTSTWSMGNNGPAGGTGQGRIHDISAVALGNDASVFGPVSAKLPVDNIAPQASGFFPAANATNISAGTVISMALKDAGLGLDTGSVILKVNGAAVKPTRSGTVWNSTLFYKPPVSFPAGTKVNVEVTARDVSVPANVMAPTAYSFTIAGTPAIRFANPVAGSRELQTKQIVFNLLGQQDASSNIGSSRILLIRAQENKAVTKRVLIRK